MELQVWVQLAGIVPLGLIIFQLGRMARTLEIFVERVEKHDADIDDLKAFKARMEG